MNEVSGIVGFRSVEESISRIWAGNKTFNCDVLDMIFSSDQRFPRVMVLVDPTWQEILAYTLKEPS